MQPAEEHAMLANVNSLTVNPMFLRHDLLIELGRLEIAIGDIRRQSPANDPPELSALETRHSTLSLALGRIAG